jgi:hypothetical protein
MIGRQITVSAFDFQSLPSLNESVQHPVYLNRSYFLAGLGQCVDDLICTQWALGGAKQIKDTLLPALPYDNFAASGTV